MGLSVRGFVAPGGPCGKTKARCGGHNGLNAARTRADPPSAAILDAGARPQPPNTTLFLIRPGASVNKPVTASARVKIQIIAER